MVQKIAYNACHGGFGLSELAYAMYAELSGFTLYIEEREFGFNYYKIPAHEVTDENYDEVSIYHGDMKRDDPILVRVIEKLGNDASDKYSF